MSRAAEIKQELQSQGPRRAGSDAERRAAVWLAAQAPAGAELQTFWCRPSWLIAQGWHVLLAIAGSLVSTTSPKLGGVLILAALVCLIADWLGCLSPGRLLSPERASQNVVCPAGGRADVKLVLTAGYDSTPLELGHRRRLPGWLFWLCLLTAWLLATSIARIEQPRVGTGVAVLQLIPTVGLVLAGASLLLLHRPRDNAGAAATAVALARALSVAPPANLDVELVLAGAAANYGLGLRHHLRRLRKQHNPTNTVVLGIEDDPEGFHLVSDGPLLPLNYFRRLRELAAETGMLAARPGRGTGAALPARMRQLPALTIGGPPEQTVTAGLLLVDAIDAYVGELRSAPPAASRSRPGPRPRWLRRA